MTSSPLLVACGLGLGEFGGGLALVAGFLTPMGALAVTVVMLNAVYRVHRSKGFFNTNGGYEFNLLIAASALALVATGPGRYSLDHAIGWADDITGAWWALGVAAAAVVVAFLTLTAGRRRASLAQAQA